METIYLPKDSMHRYQATVDSRSVVCKGYACHQCSGTCGLLAIKLFVKFKYYEMPKQITRKTPKKEAYYVVKTV